MHLLCESSDVLFGGSTLYLLFNINLIGLAINRCWRNEGTVEENVLWSQDQYAGEMNESEQ